MALLAGLDLGTTTLKAILYDSESGAVLKVARQPTPVSHPRDGWSEHNVEILWDCACACLQEACAGKPVKALAISSMAEAGVPVDHHGQPLAHAIAWFDRRSAPQATQIEETIGRDRLYRITGQRVTASFGLTKWMWIQQNQPEIAAQTAAWLPLPAYILSCLTGINSVDYSIASRALLLDQNRMDWSPELMALGNLTSAMLPSLVQSASPAGRLTAEAAYATGLPVGIPVAPGGHDHLCATFAAGGYEPGAVVDSSGTACALVLVTSSFQSDPALGGHGFCSYAHVVPGCFMFKGGLKAAGSAIEWTARLLSGLGRDPDYKALEAAARSGVGVRSGPLWLPHWLDSGSPEADTLSRAALVGAVLEHNAGDVYRGLLEALACWLRQNLEEMSRASGLAVRPPALLGGAHRTALLCELKAHLIQRPVILPQMPEAAGVGAALLAGLACREFDTPRQAVDSLQYGAHILEPNPGLSEWYDRLYRRVYLPLYGALRETHHAM